MAYETDTSKINDDVRAYAVYKDGEVNEATMFTPKSKVGRCASCGEAMPGYNKVIAVTSGKAEYALMNGTWVYTYLDKESEESTKVFVDVSEKENTSKQIETSVIVSYSVFEKGEGWTTAKFTIGTPTYSSKTEQRTLTIDEVCTIGENGEDWTLLNSEGEDMLVNDDNHVSTLVFIDGHHHQYKESPVNNATDIAASVYADPYFENVTFLGQNLMDNKYHYMSCTKCGITNYPVSHATSDCKDINTDKVCTCGYTRNTDKESGNVYYSVSIYTSDIEYDQSKYYEALSQKKKIDATTVVATTKADPDSATAPAAEAVEAAIKAEGAASLTGTKSGALKTVADALVKAITNGESSALQGAITDATLKGYVKSYSEDSTDAVVAAYNELVATETDPDDGEGWKGPYALNDQENLVNLAVDKLANAIIAAAKSLAENAVAKAKADSLTKIEQKPLEEYKILRGTVLDLDFDSYRTSKGGTITFKEDTGWSSVGEGAKLTASGYQIVGNAILVCQPK